MWAGHVLLAQPSRSVVAGQGQDCLHSNIRRPMSSLEWLVGELVILKI